MATEESDLLEHEPEAMDVEGEEEGGGEQEVDVLSDAELEKTAEEYARYLVVNCQKEVQGISIMIDKLDSWGAGIIFRKEGKWETISILLICPCTNIIFI